MKVTSVHDVESATTSLRTSILEPQIQSRQSNAALLHGKRVVAVINHDSGGGVEQLAAILGQNLSSKGAQYEVLYMYPRSGNSKWKKLCGIAQTAWSLATRPPDILLTFQPTSSAVAMTIGRLVGCRVRIAHQSNLPGLTHPIPRAIDKLIGTLGFYTINIANTLATQKCFDSYPRKYRQHIRLIEHGAHYTRPTRNRQSVRDQLNIPQNAPVLLSCARLSEQKSIDVLIAALPQLPNTHLLLAGEGPLKDELSKFANTIGVGPRTHFLGFIPMAQLADLYGASDIYVSPSKWESFGLSTIEAAMHGLPVVASSIPATMEVLGNNSNSPTIFVDDWNPSTWTHTLSAATSSPLFPTLKEKAARFAPQIQIRYSEDKMLSEFNALINEIVTS